VIFCRHAFILTQQGKKINIKPKTIFSRIVETFQKSAQFFCIFKINFSQIDYSVEFIEVILLKKSCSPKKKSTHKPEIFFRHFFAKKIISVFS